MSRLDELQTWMAAALQSQRAVERDDALTAEARSRITGNDRMRPESQLEVYREQFWLRHTGALLEDFEALSALLGQSQWERLTQEYLAAHPPDSFTLRDLGQRLPVFMEDLQWLSHPRLCLDMARAEWAYVEAFDAANSAPLNAERLGAIPEAAWPTARISLSPALRLLSVRYPVAALRRKIRLGEDWEIPSSETPQNLVIYRGLDRDLHHEVLGDLQFALLQALAAGQALVPAAEAVVAAHPGSESVLEAELSQWFASFSAHGWFTDVRVDTG